MLELGDHRARQRLELLAPRRLVRHRLGMGLEERLVLREARDARRGWPPSTSTLTVPSGSFSSCSTVPTVPTR